MSSVLPSELWALIVSFVASSFDDADLLSLLTLSRQMHAYAEPELLRDVYLPVDYASDDSQSPVIQFHRCISAPNNYRQHLVQSLYFDFLEEEPFPSEIQALEQLIPTLTNLRSLSLDFAWYKPSKHGHLCLFEQGIGGLALRDLEIAVHGSDVRLDITGLLKSQPSIHYLSLSGSITATDINKLLPHLRSLNVSLDTPLSGLSLDGVVHLSILLNGRMEMVPSTFVYTLTTLSCSIYEPTTFHAFLPMAPNLRNLEIYLKDNHNEDMNILSPLRHSKITHIRCLLRVTWLFQFAHSNDVFTLDVFPPSLQCVELALRPQPGHGPSCGLRWYRGTENPVTVKWDCDEEEIWLADWERDFRNIPCQPVF